MRVTTSGLLPAAAGVMKVTGFAGKSCAWAVPLATIAAARPSAFNHWKFIVFSAAIQEFLARQLSYNTPITGANCGMEAI